MKRWARVLRADVLAGLPGAVSSVADGMASSVLAGVNPAHGLYASFAGPIAGGLTSSTRLMVVTTTNAAALAAGSALASVPPERRSAAMLWLTLLTGGILLLAAVMGVSRIVRFVSYSVMLGFLSGVALNMVLGQLADLVGIQAEGRVALTKAFYCLTHLTDVQVASLLIGGLTMGLLVGVGHSRVGMLASLAAIVVPTAVVWGSGAEGVALVSDAGVVPRGLPWPGLPDWGALQWSLVPGAAAVAALVLIQGAGVAEAAPNRDGSPSSLKQDFTAQGLANLASGVWGGQPVGGSVGQTALNIAAGARSRWAAVWTGLWMAFILLTLSGLVGHVPMPSLAAVLIYAGWGALHPVGVLEVMRVGRISALCLSATLIAVLLLPVATAVGVGVIASLLLQLNQDALDLRVVRLQRRDDGAVVELPVPDTVGPGEVLVLDVHGSLLYAGARTLSRRLPSVSAGQDDHAGPVVVLRLRGRTTLGATFLKMVSDYARQLEGAGGGLYLSGLDPALVNQWRRGGSQLVAAGIKIFPASRVRGEATESAVAEAHRVTGRDRHRTDPDR